MSDESSPASDRSVEHVTCLGCGCACDDITVVVRAGRIAEARQACALGLRWFGDGVVPARLRPEGAGDVAAAIALAAHTLSNTVHRTLVYLAADVPCETQRAAVAVADVLGAVLDSITSATAGSGVLAAQRRGRTGATLGEIRNRADMVLFWAVDPGQRYPRYASRYAPEPEGLFVPGGRPGRTVVAVDVGSDRGPADADDRVSVRPEEEVMVLSLIRAALQGRTPANAPADSAEGRASALAARLRTSRYLAIVADGEPANNRDPRRAEALLALATAFNTPTRCALSTLRAGGNRSGADAVMTWQTGFPMAVDFNRGAPTYRPDDDAATLLARHEIGTVLVVGSPDSVPDAVRTGLTGVPCIVIGPRASDSPFSTTVAIDTGVAGIHERGTAIRMDDIPLPLRPALEPAPAATFRDRYGPGGPPVPIETITTLRGLSGIAADDSIGVDEIRSELARRRANSPEIAAIDALSAAGQPQDSYTVLRTLGAVLAQRLARP